MPYPLRTLSALLLLATVAVPTLAAESAKEQAIDYRRGLMEVFGWNLTAMGAVMKGEAPYDKAAFDRHARDLASAAQLDLLKGFPEDSVSDESDAMDEIWLQWPLFTDKFRTLQEESGKLASISASGDIEKIRPQFQETVAACKGCHKEFKK